MLSGIHSARLLIEKIDRRFSREIFSYFLFFIFRKSRPSNGYTGDQHTIDIPDTPHTINERRPLLPQLSINPLEASGAYGATTWNTDQIHDEEYLKVIEQARSAIDSGVLPVRIVAGSSGSYFVRNTQGVSGSFDSIH